MAARETPLRVGIIGVNAERGWARDGHVPAVQGLDGLELSAVATRRQASADAAAAAFGAARAYGDALDLIADPDVDVVDVASSVPTHRELVLAALNAGKHVYCEWPLGVDVDQAEEIGAAAARAASGGVHTVIGVQARSHPAVAAAARLIEEGAIGRPISASILSTTAGFGPVVGDGELYLEDPATGMHLVTIQVVHTADLASRVLGPIEDLSTLLSVRFPDLSVGDPARHEHRVLPDHVLLHAELGGAIPLNVEVAAGRPPTHTPFRFDVVGERATLGLVGGHPRGFQAGTLTLLLDGEPQTIDDTELAALPTAAVNVASTYAALRDDITTGSHEAPDFEHARRLAHLVDDIHRSDHGRQRVTSKDWPLR